MPSVPFFRFRFTSSWSILLLATTFFLLFLRLGFWQIQRADEKKQMLVLQERHALLTAVHWDGNEKTPTQYERIKVQGHYLPQVFLLDNQHYRHQFGYDVLSPLALKDGSIILIDRGWIPGDMSRRIFPNIQIPQELVALQGMVYFPAKNQWVLGPALEKKAENTVIIEHLDVQLVQQVLQKSVYPFIIRLDKQDSHGFVREWEIVSMPPQRHLAYALQWFAMAFVILIIFIALNLKKKNEKKIL